VKDSRAAAAPTVEDIQDVTTHKEKSICQFVELLLKEFSQDSSKKEQYVQVHWFFPLAFFSFQGACRPERRILVQRPDIPGLLRQ
jgi:hypothetical protein